MELTIQLVLAIWGATVATVLVFVKIYELIGRKKSELESDTEIIYQLVKDEEKTYGVKIQLEQGSYLTWQEALVKLIIRPRQSSYANS